MFVSANTYNRIKNKWENQLIHKIHNDIHSACKHYANSNNDIIFSSKHPINQHKHKKKFESVRKRQNIHKEIAFDFDDFVFKNKNENYKRITIRPTIHYNINYYKPMNIDRICYQFYDKVYNYDGPNRFRRHNINFQRSFLRSKHTKAHKNGSKPIEIKPFNPEICFQCNRRYDLDNYQCSHCLDERWMQSLFEGDKVDIFDDKYYNWYIGTIIEIKKKENKDLSLLIHYDGFSSIYNEWIISTSYDKIKKLHTITSYHAYERNNNHKICIQRKCTKCIYCCKKYCICIRLLDNICSECVKCIKKNEWMKHLKSGDKLDVYLYGYKGAAYDHKWHCGWSIGTVMEIKHDGIDGNTFKLCIEYDGLEREYNEWINIDCSLKSMRFKLKKLNKITLFHKYLLQNDDNNKICVEIDDWKKCISCHWKCCLKCINPGIVIADIGYQCIDCGISNECSDLYDVIDNTLFDEYCNMKMNIVQIIYDFSMGIAVQCCNCVNEINFDTKYEMELNAQHNVSSEIYQYYIYKHQRTNVYPNVSIYNRKRRIFCKECTGNELIECIFCNKNKEIRSIIYGINMIYKCQECLDIMKERKKEKEKEKEERKEMREIRIQRSDVDAVFKRFKDDIFPEIILKKSRTKQNIKLFREILQKYHIHIENLPYGLWSIECKYGSKCGREYCSFYHCGKEKEIGDIMSITIEKIKYEKHLNYVRIYGRSANAELMDYNFNLQYLERKMMKRRNNNVSRKYNVKRSTKKTRKRRAYFLRKKDKRCNVKQNRKFKAKCYLNLVTYI